MFSKRIEKLCILYSIDFLNHVIYCSVYNLDFVSDAGQCDLNVSNRMETLFDNVSIQGLNSQYSLRCLDGSQHFLLANGYSFHAQGCSIGKGSFQILVMGTADLSTFPVWPGVSRFRLLSPGLPVYIIFLQSKAK